MVLSAATSIIAACSVVVMVGRIFTRSYSRKMIPLVQSTASVVVAAQVYSHDMRWVWPIISIVGDAPIMWVLGYANYISVINIMIIIILDSLRLMLTALVIISEAMIYKWFVWTMSLVAYLPVLFFVFGDVELDVFIGHNTENRQIDRILSIGNYLLLSWAAYPIVGTIDLILHSTIRVDHMIIIDLFSRILLPLWLIIAP